MTEPSQPVAAPRSELSQQTHPLASQKPRPWQALQTWWGKVVALFALVGVIQSIDFCLSMYADTIPEVQAPGPNDSPFALPFTVKNNSHFLPMRDVQWECGSDLIAEGYETRLPISGFRIAGDPPTLIEPRQRVAFRCAVVAQKDVQPVIRPIIHYRTLWIERAYAAQTFTWYPNANPPRWIESDVELLSPK